MPRCLQVRSECMCGLSGEITFDGSLADTAAVDRMVCALVPRGPDGQGSWSAGRVAFGHRRLSVIDLSTAGGQAMVDNELGLTAVFNGCIYDYQELRTELEGHGYRFFSTSDTEVLIKGYHHWGTDVVDHLHGMFAVVIHERDTGRVVMARDRLGIKPLYLAETPQRLRFASSLPALLRGGEVDTSIDPVALHHYLTWHAVVPAPHTIVRGVRKLPPARRVTSSATPTSSPSTSAPTTTASGSPPTSSPAPWTTPSARWPSRWSATTSSPSTCSASGSASRSGWCSPGRAPTRCSPATT